MSARALPDGFEPYVWTSTSEDVAARNGIPVARVIRFDANVPPLPGVPQVPVGESFARLNEYPEGTYRELREAAADYVGVDAAQIVPGPRNVRDASAINPSAPASRGRPTRCMRSRPRSREPR